MRFQTIQTRLQESLQNVVLLFLNTLIWPFRFTNSIVVSLLEWTFLRAKTTAHKILLVVLMFLIVLWISIFSYASFYNAYVPSAEISKPVYLGFRVCPEGSGVCSFPTANVSFGRSFPSEEILSPGQRYRVILELEMPDSHMNRELGMFMVAMRMFDRNYYISAESRRSVVPRYRSFAMRVIDKFVWSPFYFFGFVEEKQSLSVEVFSSFVDDYYHPSIGATIEVQSYKIQIYSAQVKLFASFTGLKYLLHHWPVTSAFFGIWWNMLICFMYLSVNMYNKRATFQFLSESLQVESQTHGNDDVSRDVSVLSEEDDVERESQSTQTKETDEDDDPESFDLPLIQEPVDFQDDDNNLALMAELRHRRVH